MPEHVNAIVRNVPAAVGLCPDIRTATVSLIATTAGVGLLVSQRRKLAGTTMVAPWGWSIFSFVSIGLSEAAIGFRSTAIANPTFEAVRYMAAVTIFCPVMAMLGAKRPQNRAWQFVVATLWAIMAMPAAQHLTFHPEQTFSLHPVQSWFLLLLGLVALLNIVLTRYWPAGVLFLGAQWALLTGHLPFANTSVGALGPLMGIGLAIVAIASVAAGLPRRRRIIEPVNRVWLDFRDTFGALWALRVADRVNAACKMYDWGIQLSWSGFWDSQEGREISAAKVPEALYVTLENLLRRFVSEQWIASRLGKRIN